MSLRLTHSSLLALATAALLSACGGGGGSSGSTTPTPTQPSSGIDRCGLTLNYANGVTVGDMQQVIAMECSPTQYLQWTQLSGPSTLDLVSTNQAALRFPVKTAGSYALRLTFTDSQQRTVTRDVNFTATATTAPTMVIRGEGSVWGGGQSSLRVWPQLTTGETVSKVTWTQISGSLASMATGTEAAQAVVFTAPNVGTEEVIKLRAVVDTSLGRSLQADASVLVQPSGTAPSSAIFSLSDNVSPVHAFVRTGPYAQQLERCIYNRNLYYNSNTDQNFCTLTTLPLLGHETNGALPTVDQIMSRVLVSHDWMGENFRQFLLTQDVNGDWRRMLNATTAIVIGSRVRPSFYWSYTGAIYLDANYLWLTPEQRDSICERPDPRSAYGNDLQFYMPWRYVKDNNYASINYPLASRASRTTGELVVGLGSLMYHELTHANDFSPPAAQAGMNRSVPLFMTVPATTPSLLLNNTYPLKSAEMVALGRVQFFGVTATATQKTYTPSTIAGWFSADLASDNYNYSTPPSATYSREDIAMLMEEFYMSYRHGVQRDVAITGPVVANTTGNNLMVTWGQRGRIGDAALRPRLKLAIAQTAPWLNTSVADTLPATLMMQAGASWNTNLVLTANGAAPAPQLMWQGPAMDLNDQIGLRTRSGHPWGR
ncbi:MAG: hypothetical protein E6Q92_12455 [Burkholderiaceae bacterium]|nr:MAG: hypothetical protein E6Q92_12455 [Burkholderiaceae bacterium]